VMMMTCDDDDDDDDDEIIIFQKKTYKTTQFNKQHESVTLLHLKWHENEFYT